MENIVIRIKRKTKTKYLTFQLFVQNFYPSFYCVCLFLIQLTAFCEMLDESLRKFFLGSQNVWIYKLHQVVPLDCFVFVYSQSV